MFTKTKTPTQGINEAVREATFTSIALIAVVFIALYFYDPSLFKHIIKF